MGDPYTLQQEKTAPTCFKATSKSKASNCKLLISHNFTRFEQAKKTKSLYLGECAFKSALVVQVDQKSNSPK